MNLIRPIEQQPFLKIVNATGVTKFTIGTYFHQTQGRRTEKVLSRHGYYYGHLIFYENFLKANLSSFDIRFTDLVALGNGNGYKIGFLLQYQSPTNQKYYCDAINSNTELTILDSVSIIYTNPMTWIGLGILVISMILLLIVPFIFQFKDKPKGKCLYFKYGIPLRNIIGYDHETYLKYSCMILSFMIFILLLSLAVLIPIDLSGPHAFELNNDLASISLATVDLNSYGSSLAHILLQFFIYFLLLVITYGILLYTCLTSNKNKFSVKIDHVPQELTEDLLFEMLENEYGEGSVVEVCKLFDDSKSVKFYNQAIDISNEIKEINEKILLDEENIKLISKKEKLLKELELVKEKVAKAQLKNLDLEQVIITYTSTKYVHQSISKLPTGLELFHATKVRFFSDDIIWKNYKVSWIEILIRMLIIWSISMLFFIALASISTMCFLLQYVSQN